MRLTTKTQIETIRTTAMWLQNRLSCCTFHRDIDKMVEDVKDGAKVVRSAFDFNDDACKGGMLTVSQHTFHITVMIQFHPACGCGPVAKTTISRNIAADAGRVSYPAVFTGHLRVLLRNCIELNTLHANSDVISPNDAVNKTAEEFEKHGGSVEPIYSLTDMTMDVECHENNTVTLTLNGDPKMMAHIQKLITM